jgi:hypothetical protein
MMPLIEILLVIVLVWLDILNKTALIVLLVIQPALLATVVKLVVHVILKCFVILLALCVIVSTDIMKYTIKTKLEFVQNVELNA